MNVKPIRILHVTFNMGFGGTEQVIRQLVTHLPSDRFTNEILCIDGRVGQIGLDLQREGIPVTTLPRRPGFDWRLIRALRNVVIEGRFDVVHCHQYTPYVYGWLAALGTGARVILTEHGRFHPDRYRYKARLINPLMARMTFALVAISAATREALGRYEFMPQDKVRVIYNGIQGLDADADASARIRQDLGIPGDAFVVGTVARLDPVKNQSMMLRAFSQVKRQVPGAWLLMVGDGPDRAELEGLAKTLGVDDQVIFTGFIASPKDHLATMDVFLLSSHTEGTSMTLLEAMSLGIPSVVTNVGGNPEIVTEGENGFLVRSDDEKAFANAMLRLHGDTLLRQQMASNSRKLFTERFSVQKMVDAYSNLYHPCKS